MTLPSPVAHPASRAALMASVDAHQQASEVLAERNPSAAHRHLATVAVLRAVLAG